MAKRAKADVAWSPSCCRDGVFLMPMTILHSQSKGKSEGFASKLHPTLVWFRLLEK